MPEADTLIRTISVDILLSELEKVKKQNDAGEWAPGMVAEGPLTASDLIECIKKSI